MKPRILIAGPDREREYLKPYSKAVAAAGGAPVLALPPTASLEDEQRLMAFLAQYDGLLLPGGADVDPSYYGDEPHPKLGKLEPYVDAGQIPLVRLALRASLPTLGICRGLQVLTVAAGGKLYQDLPSQLPSPVIHRIKNPKQAIAHEVQVAEDSRLSTLCGGTRFGVNSRHHQAAREGEPAGQIGNLIVVARAPDGVVEGMEDPTHPFMVAVQWRPENLVSTTPEARRLFAGFVAACGLPRK